MPVEPPDEAHKLHVVFDGSRALSWIDEIHAHTAAVGDRLEAEGALVELVLQPLRILLPAFHVVPERLDVVVPDRGSFIDGSNEVLGPVPVGTRVYRDPDRDVGFSRRPVPGSQQGGQRQAR